MVTKTNGPGECISLGMMRLSNGSHRVAAAIATLVVSHSQRLAKCKGTLVLIDHAGHLDEYPSTMPLIVNTLKLIRNASSPFRSRFTAFVSTNAAVTCLVLCLGGCVAPGSFEDSPTLRASDPAVRQRTCKALIASYQSALERSFEVESNSLHSPDDLRRDWYKALVSVHVSTRDVDGRYRDPTDVVQEVVANLAKVTNGDDRHRLEYVLLGSAMPLEARREFEKVCVATVF
jgi:hypothetical protein